MNGVGKLNLKVCCKHKTLLVEAKCLQWAASVRSKHHALHLKQIISCLELAVCVSIRLGGLCNTLNLGFVGPPKVANSAYICEMECKQ
jgi:hypothetical protein